MQNVSDIPLMSAIFICLEYLPLKVYGDLPFQHGQTPLHLAAENDHSDVVKLFLKHKPELVTLANTVSTTMYNPHHKESQSPPPPSLVTEVGSPRIVPNWCLDIYLVLYD